MCDEKTIIDEIRRSKTNTDKMMTEKGLLCNSIRLEFTIVNFNSHNYIMNSARTCTKKGKIGAVDID